MIEKIQQDFFIRKLKQSNWIISEEITDAKNKSRADVIAYHPIIGESILFELKMPKGLNDETKALRQMIRYRNSYFRRNIKLFCYMKPKTATNYDWVIKRFFWRWGFGYGSLENMIVEFVNGENKNTINLLYPERSYPPLTPKQKIEAICETSQKYWENKEEIDQMVL